MAMVARVVSVLVAAGEVRAVAGWGSAVQAALAVQDE